jgi:hypothetical protein
VPTLFKISPAVLEKKNKMQMFNRQTDGQTTDSEQSEKLTSAYSSGEVKEKKTLRVRKKINP